MNVEGSIFHKAMTLFVLPDACRSDRLTSADRP